MKIAVISDIHGNMEALEEVIKSIESKGLETVICLGDLVGYGPDPEKVVKKVIECRYQCILGNHEVALLEKRERRRLNFQAKENNISTKKLLSESSLRYCKSLSRSYTFGDALFVHGFPPDSVYKYSFRQSDEVVEELLEKAGERCFFVGHTHTLFLLSRNDHGIEKSLLHEGLFPLEKKKKYLINVGSVGQPRDGDNRAKYVIWDTEANHLEVVCVPYDYEATILKIKSRGFPEAYGLRLR